jgi:methionine-rich copper-binding protein CopC
MPKTNRSLILAAIISIVTTGASWADALLASAVPAENDTITTAPVELDLKFSEEVSLKSTVVKLSGPDKFAIATGAASLKMNDPTTLIVPITGGLKSGNYTVEWRAVSTAGKETHGSYHFALKL